METRMSFQPESNEPEFSDKPAYRYPLNAGEEFRGKIKFTLKKIPPISLEDAKAIRDTFASQNEDAVDASALEGDNRSSDPVLPDPYGGSVTLYLPGAITINDGVDYENVELGAIGAAVEAGAENRAGIALSIAGGVTEALGTFIDAFAIGTGAEGALGRLAVSRVAQSAVVPAGVGGAIISKTRATLNPNARSIFKSVKIREFPFSFKMTATSRDEAYQIRKIIKFFRTELYPGRIGSANKTFTVGYELPNPFKIQMFYDNLPIPGTKILESYLTSVGVVYNENGMVMHSDGYFTEVTISLNFIEARALTKEDLNGE